MDQPFQDKPTPPPVGGKPSGSPPAGAAGQTTSDDRLWATLAHLSPLVIGLFGPLIIWLVKKEDSPFVEDQAKEALNFQLAVLIVGLISIVTCIGPFVVAVGAIVFEIIAGIDANKGNYYRYPYTIRMIQ